MKFRRVFVFTLTVAFLAGFTFPSDAFGQRSRSRSSGRSSWSRPKTSTPKSSKKWGSNKKTSSSKKGWGSSSKKSKAKTKADQAAFDKAKKSGKQFPNTATGRKAASDRFRSNPANKKKYTSTYASKPKQRPSHIPKTTKVGGKDVTIIYDQSHGGYGYMSAGRWIMYDALADAAMMSMLMQNNGYYFGDRPIYQASSIGIWVGGFTLGVIILAILAVVATRRTIVKDI